MKKNYVAPQTATVKVCGELLAPHLQLGSIGQQTQLSGKFQTVETFRIEENMQFSTTAEKSAFWDDWQNGAD